MRATLSAAKGKDLLFNRAPLPTPVLRRAQVYSRLKAMKMCPRFGAGRNASPSIV